MFMRALEVQIADFPTSEFGSSQDVRCWQRCQEVRATQRRAENKKSRLQCPLWARERYGDVLQLTEPQGLGLESTRALKCRMLSLSRLIHLHCNTHSIAYMTRERFNIAMETLGVWTAFVRRFLCVFHPGAV